MLDGVLEPQVEGASLALRQQLANALLVAGRPDRPWSLVAGDARSSEALCLSADDWKRVARLMGRDGIPVLSACMIGTFPASDLVARAQSVVDPVAGFLDAHPEAVLLPGERGPMSTTRSVRRVGEAPRRPTHGDLTSARVEIRERTGERSNNDLVLDALSLVLALDERAVGDLAEGRLTVWTVVNGSFSDKCESAEVRQWVTELRNREVDPEALIVLGPPD